MKHYPGLKQPWPMLQTETCITNLDFPVHTSSLPYPDHRPVKL